MDTTPAPTIRSTIGLTTTGLATETTPARRGRLARFAAKAALVTGGIAAGVAGGAAYAASFSDVPVSHPFYDEIEWVAEAGVANGFPDGTYRPGDPVTRGSMAAFLQRLWELQDTTYAANMSGATSTSASSWQNIEALIAKVTVPAGTEANLHAQFTAESQCQGGTGYCRVRIVAQKVGGGPVIELGPVSGADFAFDNTNNDTEIDGSWESHGVGRSTLDALPPGEYNVGVQFSTSEGGTTQFRLDDANLQVAVDLVPAEDLPIVIELS